MPDHTHTAELVKCTLCSHQMKGQFRRMSVARHVAATTRGISSLHAAHTASWTQPWLHSGIQVLPQEGHRTEKPKHDISTFARSVIFRHMPMRWRPGPRCATGTQSARWCPAAADSHSGLPAFIPACGVHQDTN